MLRLEGNLSDGWWSKASGYWKSMEKGGPALRIPKVNRVNNALPGTINCFYLPLWHLIGSKKIGLPLIDRVLCLISPEVTKYIDKHDSVGGFIHHREFPTWSKIRKVSSHKSIDAITCLIAIHLRGRIMGNPDTSCDLVSNIYFEVFSEESFDIIKYPLYEYLYRVKIVGEHF
ncbi:hypothetical protein L1D46_07855 [Pseudoalteromonas sp. Isolate3]|uniref:hypothetical protein n=1 Tax=Pseudoalteromonas sp. Isolate3 TaxID=2908526 RepID=UPI001EFCA0CD|nr:hypothetical protein [Pseudoalteromonas sp. Isolate3]MCG9708719.1 hypothetical protein [Pseudoalteromonas sp. Isolate3]